MFFGFLIDLFFCFFFSVSGLDMGKIEEMEKMLKEVYAEKSRFIEFRVRYIWVIEVEGGESFRVVFCLFRVCVLV